MGSRQVNGQPSWERRREFRNCYLQQRALAAWRRMVHARGHESAAGGGLSLCCLRGDVSPAWAVLGRSIVGLPAAVPSVLCPSLPLTFSLLASAAMCYACPSTELPCLRHRVLVSSRLSSLCATHTFIPLVAVKHRLHHLASVASTTWPTSLVLRCSLRWSPAQRPAPLRAQARSARRSPIFSLCRSCRTAPLHQPPPRLSRSHACQEAEEEQEAGHAPADQGGDR